MKRQKYFYHASPYNDLKEISPRANTTPKGFKEGPCVFATNEYKFATQFIAPHDDSWANGGAFSGQPFFVISDRERFEEADKGGSIYLLPSKEFKKFNRREWYASGSVKVVDKVDYSSGLTAMIIHGVQVYLTDLETYENIQTAPDHGMSILNSLTSENEKWGYPVEKLDLYKGSKKRVD